MPDLATLGLFALAALTLLLIPGPSVIFIVTRSLYQGRWAGLVSALGVQAGGLLHVLAATVGLSALLLSSALLFSVVKYLGAAYLIYLGIKTLLAKTEDAKLAVFAPQPLRQIFWQGALVNALNPKTALFFLAFLPQFIRPGHGAVALQTLILGVSFLLLAVLSDGAYALLAGSLRPYLSGNRVFACRQKYATGGIYIALGAGAALGTHQ